MTNPANTGILIGRLSQDVKEFPNADGSKGLAITLAVEDDFKSGPKQEVQTNFVSLRDYVRAGSTSSWDRVHKGDLIAISYRVNAKPYVKDGVTQYPTSLEVDGFPKFLEPKAVTDARAAKNAVEAGAAAPVAGPPAVVAGDPAAASEIARLEAELAAAQAGTPTADSPFPG